MSIDLSKVQFASTYNSFKNDGLLYTGSISFPTSLTAAQQYTATTTISTLVNPQFSKFYANFLEIVDAINSVGSPQWYDATIAANSVAILVTGPPGEAGWINCGVYPIISGNEIVVTASIFNPYPVSITLQPLTVSFAFFEYTLAD